MGWDITTINGVALGFEILNKEMTSYIPGAEDAKWGLCLDLVIFRVLLVKF